MTISVRPPATDPAPSNGGYRTPTSDPSGPVIGAAAQTQGKRRGLRGFRSVARLLVGPAILALLLCRLGTGPFMEGIRVIDGRSVMAAIVIGLLTTVCSAWRWRLVAGGLGIRVGLLPGVAAYYRSQLLNTTLPGGVIGDVHRGVSNGRAAGNVGRGLRAVGWERAAGQFVQILLAAIVLIALPSPLPRWIPVLIATLMVSALGGAMLAAPAPHPGGSAVARIIRTAVADLHNGLFARRAWPGILGACVIVVAGHTTTFLIAARAAGATGPLEQLLPLAVLVLLAAAVPTNIGGWGPREGVAAWAFASAGLGPERGVTTAVVFGVMTAIAVLPGAVLLVAGWLHRAPIPDGWRAATRRPKRAAPDSGASAHG